MVLNKKIFQDEAGRQHLADQLGITSLVVVYAPLILGAIFLQNVPPLIIAHIIAGVGVLLPILSLVFLPKKIMNAEWTTLSLFAFIPSLYYFCSLFLNLYT